MYHVTLGWDSVLHHVVVNLINVDIDLLEACRVEFNRRLRVYHAWKERNKKQNSGARTTASPEAGQRAPQAIMQAGNSQIMFTAGVVVFHSLLHVAESRKSTPTIPSRVSSLGPKPGSDKRSGTKAPAVQRFFRVPFVSPSQQDKLNRKKGWWYAQFNGQWIVRQLELHPDKKPLLLVAGRDDLEMCELSLDETGLAIKRGAEILEHEFEEAWSRHGGTLHKPSITAL
jgi:myosin-6